MPRPILVHVSFSAAFDRVTSEPHQRRTKLIAKQLQKASELENPPGRMHIDITELQGKIYKARIQRGGLRLFFVLWKFPDKQREIVLPVYLSESVRGKCDYSKTDFSVASDILRALEDQRYGEFKVWTTDGISISRHSIPQ